MRNGRATKERREQGVGAFTRFATWAAQTTGSPWAFTAAVALIGLWGVTGPIFGFSDTWQLYANTGTTLITFLMVFLIQNTQNRDAAAMHAKLDEIIRAQSEAHNKLIGLEREDISEIEQAREGLEEFAKEPDDPKEQHEAMTAAKEDMRAR